MNDQPIYVTFEFNGNLQEEVTKMTLGIKGLSDESQKTYKRLLADSNETFSAMSAGNKQLAVSIQEDINSLRQLDAIQKEVNAAFEKGTISTDAYVQAKSRLAAQEAEIKAGITRNMQLLNDEMAAEKRAAGAITEKEAVLQRLIEKYRSLSAVQRASGEGEQLLGDIKNLKAELDDLNKNFSRATSSSESLLSSMESLPGPVGSAASGLKKMTKAAVAFIATPLGMALAAISAALAALTSWFRRTEEGENALALASATFGQVLDSLLDVVDRVGEWLYKAFTKPKEAIADLGDFIKGQFVNRLTAISKMGSAVAKIFSKDWKQGFADFNNALAQLHTGIEDAGKKTGAFFEDTKRKVKERGELERRKAILDVKKRELVVDQAIKEAQLNELRTKAYDMTIPEKQRVEALKKALELTDEISDKNIEIAKEEHNIIAIKNSLSNSNKADKMAEAEAEAKVYHLEAERNRRKREMLSQIKTLSLHIAREESKTEIDLLKKELEKKKEMYALYYQQVEKLGEEKASKAYAVLLKDGDSYLSYLQNQICKLEKKDSRSKEDNNILSFLYGEKDRLVGKKTAADLLKEEIEKLKALYGHNLLKLKQELLKLQKLNAFDTSEVGVQKGSIINDAIRQADIDAENEFRDLLNTYQTGFQQLVSLQASYERDVAFLKSRLTANSTQEEKEWINDTIKARTDAYTQMLLDLEMKDENFYEVLFGNLRDVSVETLKQALKEAEQWISNFEKKNNISPGSDTGKMLSGVKTQIGGIKNDVNGISQMSQQLPMMFGKGMGNWATQFQDAAAKTMENLQQIADVCHYIDEDLGNAMDTAVGIIGGVSDIAEGVGNVFKGDIVGAVNKSITGTYKIFKTLADNVRYNKQVRAEYEQSLLETYSKELEYNSILRERLRIQQQIGETTMQYLDRLGSELGKQSADISKEYDEVWRKLMGEEYITQTNYKHGTWFRKAKTWNDYASLSGKTYEEIEGFYTEGKLEGAAKTLFERLKQLKEEGADVADMLDDLNEDMKENFTGTTVSSMADTILKSFSAGKGGAKDLADYFQERLKEAVLQGVKLKALEGPLRQWYESFAAASQSGLDANKIAQLREQYNKIIADAAEELKNMEDITGVVIGGAPEREATAKGLQSVSQDSVDELLGIGNTSVYYLDKIHDGVTNINAGLAKSLGKLTEIAQNTSYCKLLENMEKDTSEIRSNVERMVIKGVRIGY